MKTLELVRVNDKGHLETLPLTEWAKQFNEARRLPKKEAK